MAASQAQLRATKKWQDENYWKATVMLPKDYKDRIKATGETSNAFIKKAVEDRLAKAEHKEV